MTDDATLPRAGLLDEVRTQAAELERRPGFPAEYVDRARGAAARLSALDTGDDVRHAALVVEHHAVVTADVPTTAALAPVSFLKRAIKRLLLWYLRFLAQQVTGLGRAVAHLATAVADRVEGIEARQDQHEAAVERELGDLKARIERLEGTGAEGRPPG